MQLNPDCVRDILFYIEDNTGYNETAEFENVTGKSLFSPTELNTEHPSYCLINKYGADVLYYHLNYCEKSGLVEDSEEYTDIIYISDLTPMGHEFLSNIRADNVWTNTKEIANKVGSKSLDSLIQISSSVITKMINSQFSI